MVVFLTDKAAVRNATKSQDVDPQSAQVNYRNSKAAETFVPSLSLIWLDKTSSGFERRAGLRQRLASADVTEVLELLEKSSEVDNDYLKIKFQTEILRRLSSIDPELAMSRVMASPRKFLSDFLPAVIEEWAESDRKALLAYVSTLDQSSLRTVLEALMSVSDTANESDLREMALATGYQGSLTGLLEGWSVKAAIHDPERSWNTVINDGWNNGSQIDSLVAIAEAWINIDGWNILDGLVESLPNRSHRTELVRKLFRRLARQDPQTAFEHARRLYPTTDEWTFHPVISEWEQQDPLAALEAVSSLDNQVLREDLQRYVVSGWAISNPQSLIEQLPSLEESIQEIARIEVIKGVARDSVADAVEMLSSVDGNIGREVFEAIGYWMAERDVRKAVEWAISDARVDEHRFFVLARMMPQIVAEDPDLAMSTAVDQPPTQWGQGLESSVIRVLVSFDRIDEAIELLPRIRDDSTKLRSYVTLGYELVMNGEIQESLELGNDLDEKMRKEYYERMLRNWAGSDPQGLFDSLDSFSSQEVQMQAANLLILQRENLLERQWTYVNALVSDQQ